MLDEATPSFDGHLAYVVTATVTIEDDPDAIAAALGHVVDVPQRSRPFHWHQEGVKARRRMMECLANLGVCAHIVIHYPTARSGMERARAAAMTTLLPLLLDDGVEDLLIERRTPDQDRRDRATLRWALNALGDPPFTYSWGSKEDPGLWLPDAVCGAVSMYLDRTDSTWFDQLVEVGVITEPIYLHKA